MSNKINKWLLIGIYGLFLILAIIFFFKDLAISIFVADLNNPGFIAKLFAVIGTFPVYLGPIIFALVFGFTLNNKYLAYASHLLGLVFTYILTSKMIKGILTTFLLSGFGAVHEILITVISFCIYVLLFLLFKKFNTNKLKEFRKEATIYVCVCAITMLIVYIAKISWGRLRFKALGDDYQGYSNYLSLNGFKLGLSGDNNRSFPSGHTASASTCLVWILFIDKLVNKKWLKHVLNILIVSLPIVVALTRIRIGAHYASDVLFGFMICFSVLVVVKYVFKKRGFFNVRSN